MSDKPISVGDLVMVVRPSTCCGSSFSGVGEIFKVALIKHDSGHRSCCGKVESVVRCLGEGHMLGYFIDRLKRLDPDALKDDVPADERVTA